MTIDRKKTIPLSERLKTARKRLGLTQSQVAEAAGISKTSQNQYEKGTRVPDAVTIAAIAKVLDVSCDFLLGFTDDPHTNRYDVHCSPAITESQIQLFFSGEKVVVLTEKQFRAISDIFSDVLRDNYKHPEGDYEGFC